MAANPFGAHQPGGIAFWGCRDARQHEASVVFEVPGIVERIRVNCIQLNRRSRTRVVLHGVRDRIDKSVYAPGRHLGFGD